MPTTSCSSAVLGASGCLLMIIVDQILRPQVQGKNPRMVSMQESKFGTLLAGTLSTYYIAIRSSTFIGIWTVALNSARSVPHGKGPSRTILRHALTMVF